MDGEIFPFHSHNTNLDDLENVQGFNSIGKRNGLYCFKLTQNGMYIREPISIFLKNDVRTDYNYEIDIKIKNNTVTCKGDSNVVNRIINSGYMFGNLVPELPKYENTTILKKINKSYYISSSTLTILNFKTKFPEDLKLLKNPPIESEFIIEGVFIK